MMQLDISIPKLVKAAVQSIEPNATIILFGSRARGDFHAESDWDFLVLLDEVNWEKWSLLVNTVYDIELEVEQIISLVIREQAEWQKLALSFFYQNVQKDGVIVH